MRLSKLLRLCGLIVAIHLAATDTYAGWPFHRHQGTPPPGKPRMIEHSHARAGFPLDIGPCAKLTNTPAYYGYHVGGGQSHGGDPRFVEEGTFGWDYRGFHIPRGIALGWGHGRREQAGTGAYKTDGHHIPDPIAATTTKIRQLESGGESEP